MKEKREGRKGRKEDELALDGRDDEVSTPFLSHPPFDDHNTHLVVEAPRELDHIRLRRALPLSLLARLIVAPGPQERLHLHTVQKWMWAVWAVRFGNRGGWFRFRSRMAELSQINAWSGVRTATHRLDAVAQRPLLVALLVVVDCRGLMREMDREASSINESSTDRQTDRQTDARTHRQERHAALQDCLRDGLAVVDEDHLERPVDLVAPRQLPIKLEGGRNGVRRRLRRR